MEYLVYFAALFFLGVVAYVALNAHKTEK